MIVSTLLAASLAAQPAAVPAAGAKEAPVAERKMACCENMAKGEACCCCKGKKAEGSDKEHAGHTGGETGGHAH